MQPLSESQIWKVVISEKCSDRKHAPLMVLEGLLLDLSFPVYQFTSNDNDAVKKRAKLTPYFAQRPS